MHRIRLARSHFDGLIRHVQMTLEKRVLGRVGKLEKAFPDARDLDFDKGVGIVRAFEFFQVRRDKRGIVRLDARLFGTRAFGFGFFELFCNVGHGFGSLGFSQLYLISGNVVGSSSISSKNGLPSLGVSGTSFLTLKDWRFV